MEFKTRTLGKTKLEVPPIGIGGGYGFGGRDLEYAFEQGINYFFWAPIFPTYINMTRALRPMLKKNREKIILATTSYFWRIPGSLERSIYRHLRWLGTDYIDIFYLGWLSTESHKKYMDVLMNFKKKGIIRHIGISLHNRKLARRVADGWPIDILMVRYNAAHRGAENEIFPYLKKDTLGVVAFNAMKHNALLKRPKNWPQNKPVPAACDCYRFVLSNPNVNLCLVGPRNRVRFDEVLTAIRKGPMAEAELKWIREFGDIVHG